MEHFKQSLFLQYLFYINLTLCDFSLALFCFSMLCTIINQSLYFIKQQRVIKKVTTQGEVPWWFVTS